MATAKHRAIDLLRRRTVLERKHEELGRQLEAQQEMAVPDLDAAIDDEVGDDLLRLVFISCHPVLSTELLPKEPEVHGLVALMEIQASRLRARIGPSGEPVLLLDQDRSRWDHVLVRHGLAALERVGELGGALGPYALRPRSPPVTRQRVPRRRRTGRASRRSTMRSPSSRHPPSWS